MTKYGQCIRFHETDVRSTGRVSMGVIGMSLADGDEVVGMQLNTPVSYTHLMPRERQMCWNLCMSVERQSPTRAAKTGK